MKKYLRTYAGYAVGMATAILLTNGGILFASQLPGSWHEINTGLPSAAADHGVFKSTNRGESWTGANTGLDSRYVSELAIDATSTLQRRKPELRCR